MANFDFLSMWQSLTDEDKKKLQEQAQGGLLNVDQSAQAPAPALLDTSAPAEPEKNRTMFGLLDGIVPQDDEKRQALAMALIQGGAGAMMAGGPSRDPMNFGSVLGAGIGAAAKGYGDARKDGLEERLTNAKLGANQIKLQRDQANKDAVAAIGVDPTGNGPMSVSQMKALYKLYLDNGEFSAANALLERIQQLDDSQRKNGALLGPNGYELAPGVAESAEDLSRAKDAGQYTSDRKDYEFGLEDPKFRQEQIDLKRAGATNITNGGGSDKQIFDTMLAENEKARQAQNGLKGIYEARNAVESGGVFGAGADQFLGLRKIGQLIGVGDVDKITNTETFRSAIAPQVSAMLKMTVGSANISNSDREFAEKAAGGSIQLDETSITRLLDIMERGNKDLITSYNSKLDTVYPGDNDTFKRERSVLGGVSVPEYTRPEKKSNLLDIGEDGKVSRPVETPPAAITTVEDYNKLPSGASYIDPRTKQIKKKK
ncbi:Hypothetical protein NGAL_HAMBI490_42880 [Neorhizobium galegae bv. officinalis]|nr:Hypothetical protein NGAL_HAMBI490_42880 [Neorhizobium galegae bv. officinalis]